MDTPNVVYQSLSRYSKQFEPIQGNWDKESFFQIPVKEIEAAGYGDAEEVPEGICVKLAVPGTAKTKAGSVYIEYGEGDLEICSADDTEIYGITLQKIVPIGTNFPYLRKQIQTSVFRGEKVAVATGMFIAMLMDLTGFGTTPAPAVKDKLYVGTKGILSVAGQNGVGGSPSGRFVAQVIGLDRLPIDRTTGAVQGGAVHQEVMIKCFLAELDRS